MGLLESLSYDNLSELPYLGTVIAETMRIDPSVTVSTQICLKEETSLGKYWITKDTNIIVCIY